MNNLCDDNFLLYAIKAYSTPNAVMAEFEEDFKRIKSVKQLIRRYQKTGILKERMILNHIIILGNVFGVEPTVRLLFYKLDPENYAIAKTFLLFLNYMPTVVRGINNKNLISADITIDIHIAKLLNQL